MLLITGLNYLLYLFDSERHRSFSYSDLYIFPFFILANIPKARPIRIDRKRRLIYFSYFGKFYIYRYPKGEIGSSYLPFYNKTIERSIKTAAYYFPMLYVNIPNKDKNS